MYSQQSDTTNTKANSHIHMYIQLDLYFEKYLKDEKQKCIEILVKASNAIECAAI